MDIFEVIKGRFRFDSKRFTTCLVVFFVALSVSVMVLMIYQNSSFEGFAKAKVLGGNTQNVTASGVGKDVSYCLIFNTQFIFSIRKKFCIIITI